MVTLEKRGYAVSDDSRFVKAKKIIACLQYIDSSLLDKEVLEIGCGSGIISHELSKVVKHMTAVDVTDETLKEAMQRYGMSETGFQFTIGDGTNLAFQDNFFDIVVCNQIFEHVRDQKKLINEIYRVLRAGGLCYIATGNKIWPVEPHTKLPFLSYLPKSLADTYIRRFRGIDEYDVILPTFWNWKRILSSKFDRVIDLTPMIIKYPEKFHIVDEIMKPFGNILTKIPLKILQMLMPFSPGWIVIAIKN